ncbi:MAG: GNAT family N-acetyltransferase, partial [Anaerocolumna sp.]
GILISTQRSLLDLQMVHGFLTTSYWAEGISRAQVERQVGASLPFGLYIEGRMLGFARVISDFTRWAMLCDVLVLPEFQGRGHGRRLVRAAMAHPELRDVNRWILATKDAHGVYEPCGFTELGKPAMWMERKLPKDNRRWV